MTDILEQPEPDNNIDSSEASYVTEPLAGDRVLRRVEDMSIAELLGQMLRSPGETVRAVMDIAGTPTTAPSPGATMEVPAVWPNRVQDGPILVDSVYTRTRPLLRTVRGNRLFVTLVLYWVALLVAIWGGMRLIEGQYRVEEQQLANGMPFLIAGFGLWLIAEFYRSWPTLQTRFSQLRAQRTTLPPPLVPRVVNYDVTAKRNEDISPFAVIAVHPIRVLAVLSAILLVLITWFETAAVPGQINEFTRLSFFTWMASVTLIVLACAPITWMPDHALARFRDQIRGVRLSWSFLALVIIMLVGLWFRLEDLDGVPPEMTSDHIEKLLDAQRVVDGDRDIFFANNGGREPFQMYALALMSRLPGLEMDFTLLKVLAVIESMITLPILWWMGRVIVGDRDRRLGNIVGLLMALLVAVSYWHVAMTRLSLRIVLTPLVASLLVIWLAKGIRSGDRGYYVLAGLTLGFGLYTYQAVRMLPLVVVAGVVIAMVFNLRNGKVLRRYIGHLTVVVVVSFVVFVPMLRYSFDFPDEFWSRTSGRLFGDGLVEVLDEETGEVMLREATFNDRIDTFFDNLPVLTDNMRNALLMFNWKGDVGWINGVPNDPAMDPFTGALLVLGVGAWGVLLVRKPDPVLVLMPVMVLIMVLPSALSIAAPLENPSATRMSGSLPPVYIIAALPLAMIAITTWQALRGRLFSGVVAVSIVAIVTGAAFLENRDTYLNEYRESYEQSWTSHSIPGGILRGFVMSDGSYGNAFLMGYIHWLDHRIVGAEAGVLDWVNGIADLGDQTAVERIPDFLHDAHFCTGPENPHVLDPNRDLLFFYNQEDTAAADILAELFPDGQARLIQGDQPRDNFYMFRVPALGEVEFSAWLARHTMFPRCVA